MWTHWSEGAWPRTGRERAEAEIMQAATVPLTASLVLATPPWEGLLTQLTAEETEAGRDNQATKTML